MSVSEIGRRLKNARLNCHMTQAEVAAKLGITYQAISNYERGTTHVGTDTLSKLCRIYKISIADLLRTPAWKDWMFDAYRNASSDSERQAFLEQWGIPSELMEDANNMREPDSSPLTALDEAILYAYHHASADDRAMMDFVIKKYVPHFSDVTLANGDTSEEAEQKTPIHVSEDGPEDSEKRLMGFVKDMNPAQQEGFYDQMHRLKEPQKESSTSVSLPEADDKAPES